MRKVKKLTRRTKIVSFSLALLMVVSMMTAMLGNRQNVLKAKALSPSTAIKMSNSYKSGSYYQKLLNVNLTGNQAEDIVAIAKSQIGYKSGANSNDMAGTTNSTSNVKYSEYGYAIGSNPNDWCAYFVSWCARQAGISDNVFPSFPGCTTAYNTTLPTHSCVMNDRGNGYSPKKGDLIFFGTSSNTYHVGLVDYSSNGVVYYIDGNNKSTIPHCVHYSHANLTYTEIRGYATPKYNGSTVTHTVDSNYPTNFTATAKSKMTVFGSNHESVGNHYVDAGDVCTIHEVYTDGCCRVTYPTGNTTATYYCYISNFEWAAAPTWATIVHAQYEYIVGETITFHFNADNNPTGYRIAINKDGSTVTDYTSGNSYSIASLQPGSYSAYVTASNYAGSADSASVQFIVTAKPTWATIYHPKYEYVVGENITFNFNANNSPTGYCIGIDKEGERLITEVVGSPSYSISTLQPGSYSAYVTASNSAGYCNSDTVYFVVTAAPKWTTISNDKYEYTYGEPVTFYFNADNNPTDYWIGIDKDGERLVTENVSGNSYTISTLLPGFYSAYVTASNAAGIDDSDSITFAVTPGKPDHIYVNPGTDTRETVFWWDAASYAEHYDVRIYRSSGELYCEPQWSVDGYVYSKQLPSGEYYFNVAATGYGTWKFSENSEVFTVEPSTFVPKATVYDNGHIYTLYDDVMSWTDAKARCESVGGHMVTITSEHEQEIINNLIQKGCQTSYWLGASDADSEGNFKWVTGESLSYTNWNAGEPNNDSASMDGCENYVHIFRDEGVPGKWNDTTNIAGGWRCGFICEIETDSFQPRVTEIFGNNLYSLYDNRMAWSDAAEYARQNGGHLVSIGSAEEQNFIFGLMQNGQRTYYLTGATNPGNAGWRWVDDTSFNYTKWLEGNPDCYGGIEFYGHMYRSTGEWNDIANICEDDNGFIVEYEDFLIPATSISLSQSTASLRVGETMTLTASVTPDDSTDYLDWTSSNTAVATVYDGIVTAVGTGSATITAQAGSKSVTCTVTVTNPATAITLSKTSLSLNKGQKSTLTATVTPNDSTDSVVWSSSNTAVATVSNGTVTAVGKGSATITAKAGSKSAICTVTVTEPTPITYDVTPNINGGASKLYEPWGLRYYAAFTGKDIDKISDRGIAILKSTYYTSGMTSDQFCSNENANIFLSSRNELTFEAATSSNPNGRYFATLTKGIYSYDIGAKYYVVPFAVMNNGQTLYGTIKSNSMENILKANLNLSTITKEEKAICTCILELKKSVAAHYEAAGVPGASVDMNIPRGSSQTAANVKSTTATGITPNVVGGASRLIEPWGLRYFATYTDSSNIAQRGMVILSEKYYQSSYSSSPDKMRLNANAYVFRDSDGTLLYQSETNRYYGTVTEGISSKDIADVYYVVPFVVLNDGSYVYGTVKSNSMMKIMKANLNSSSVPATERSVSQDIIDLYNAVKAYYAAQ